MYYAIFRPRLRQFHAGVGWTNNPVAVYRYTKEKAEHLAKELEVDGDTLEVVLYREVFEVLGWPGGGMM